MRQEVDIAVKEMVELCKSELYRLPLEQALLKAEQVGLLLRVNPVGIFSLNDVESYLVESLYSLLSEKITYNAERKVEEKKIIFIASELYHTGGHTRLMERLACSLDSKSELLMTKKNSDSIVEREYKIFSSIHHTDDDFSELERIFYYVEVILRSDIIVLNVHPEDIFAVVSCGIAKKIKRNITIHFVNHSDHTFSYGASIADVWYEISAYGQFIDAQRNLDAKKCFLGIPVSFEGVSFQSRNRIFFKNGDLILSAASNGKYKPKGKESLLKLVRLLLRRYDLSTFQIVGVSIFRDYWWWFLKMRYGKRLKLSKSLPYDEYIKVTNVAKLYIDSHPFPGGTAFVEQYLLGRICTGLINSTYKGYSPAEFFKRGNEEEVIKFIESLEHYNSSLKNIDELVRYTHSIDEVKNRFFRSIMDGTYEENLLIDKYNVSNIYVEKRISYIPKSYECSSLKHLIYLFKSSSILTLGVYLLKRQIMRFSKK